MLLCSIEKRNVGKYHRGFPWNHVYLELGSQKSKHQQCKRDIASASGFCSSKGSCSKCHDFGICSFSTNLEDAKSHVTYFEWAHMSDLALLFHFPTYLLPLLMLPIYRYLIQSAESLFFPLRGNNYVVLFGKQINSCMTFKQVDPATIRVSKWRWALGCLHISY